MIVIKKVVFIGKNLKFKLLMYYYDLDRLNIFIICDNVI